MNIKVLGLKNMLFDEQNEEYLDLTAPSYTGDYNTIKTIVAVTPEYAMRPDLVALDHMNGSSYMDALLKINSIYNPFSIDEGTFLLVPAIGSEEGYFKPPITVIPTGEEAANPTSPNPVSETDKKRIERVKQLASRQNNGVTTPLSPNMLQPGETSKMKDGGAIVLGSNMNNRDGL
jgi:hypothetical protein